MSEANTFIESGVIIEIETIKPGLLTNERTADVGHFVCNGVIVACEFESEPIRFMLNVLR